MKLGIDISNYSGVPTPAQVQCWRDAGIEFVIIGLQKTAIATGQKQACRELEREYYVDVPGRNLLIPSPGSRVWIDVEPDCFISKQQVDDELIVLKQLDFPAGIYGNATSIVPVLGNSDEYATLPLWYANSNKALRPPDFDKFIPFNGWTRPTIWQYSATTELCGVTVCFDAMEDAPVPEPVPVPPPQPTELEALRALNRTAAIIIAGDQNLADLNEDDKSALRWIVAQI